LKAAAKVKKCDEESKREGSSQGDEDEDYEQGEIEESSSG
jgi:hypothetical protein